LSKSSLAYGLTHHRWSGREYLLAGVSLFVTAALCGLVLIYWEDVRHFSRYGYIGAFIISMLAGVTVLVPVPSVFVVFTLGAVLNPILIGIIAGAGEAIGSMCVYVVGLGNARAFHDMDHGVMAKFRVWIKQRGVFSVFAMSAIFNPLFFPFTAVAGMMHFGWWRFFLLCLAGKALKNTIVAGAGYYGVQALLNAFGGQLPL
jgi:membrane protein YqaA with SNARE-associated domain